MAAGPIFRSLSQDRKGELSHRNDFWETSGDASAPVSYAEGDELLVARLKGVKGFSGDLADWRTFVTQQATTPNLEFYRSSPRGSF